MLLNIPHINRPKIEPKVLRAVLKSVAKNFNLTVSYCCLQMRIFVKANLMMYFSVIPVYDTGHEQFSLRTIINVFLECFGITRLFYTIV